MKQTIIAVLLALVWVTGRGQACGTEQSEYTRVKNHYCYETSSRQREIGTE